MTPDQLADLSRVLYSPTTLVLYLASAFVYLYALTTTVGRREEKERGRRARKLGAVLAIAGIGTHIAHEIVRAMAQSRIPLGNMFEVTSKMALVGVVAGLIYLNGFRKRAELSGFVMLGGALVLASALLVYTEPGPLMPILDTWWRYFHVSLLVVAMGVFAAAFVFNSLYLLRDTGERAVARRREERMRGSTVGAAYVGDLDAANDGDPAGIDGATPSGALADRTTDTLDPSDDDGRDHDAEYAAALRAGVSPWKLAIGTAAGTSSVVWVFVYAADTVAGGMGLFVTINLIMVAVALLTRWFVPFLPSTATMDGLAHRTVAFGFVMWTVGNIAGAMWAEQSWGRFWGWDPKETGALLVWIAYAGYLHARATAGVKGRKAAWIGVGAFVLLMATYLVTNYVIIGLHGYSGL